jgi:hypothetical protein
VFGSDIRQKPPWRQHAIQLTNAPLPQLNPSSRTPGGQGSTAADVLADTYPSLGMWKTVMWRARTLCSDSDERGARRIYSDAILGDVLRALNRKIPRRPRMRLLIHFINSSCVSSSNERTDVAPLRPHTQPLPFLNNACQAAYRFSVQWRRDCASWAALPESSSIANGCYG